MLDFRDCVLIKPILRLCCWKKPRPPMPLVEVIFHISDKTILTLPNVCFRDQRLLQFFASLEKLVYKAHYPFALTFSRVLDFFKWISINISIDQVAQNVLVFDDTYEDLENYQSYFRFLNSLLSVCCLCNHKWVDLLVVDYFLELSQGSSNFTALMFLVDLFGMFKDSMENFANFPATFWKKVEVVRMDT